ncbi:hypothetical protein [Streptomyces fragilis]|nr:hypothetical protein [Streptomyces fragilis]
MCIRDSPRTSRRPSPTPVSYTHLDVYKRQPEDLAPALADACLLYTSRCV